MGSPYPWHYTLRWPYYYFRPSTKRHTALEPQPVSLDLDVSRDQKICRLMFMGDMMCAKHDRVPVVAPGLKRLLSEADLVIGNCESPVTLTASRPDAAYLIVFQMSEEFVRGFLDALGVDPRRCVLSIANNHIGDQGEDGFRATLAHLGNVGVTVIGNAGGGSPVTEVHCNGLSLGLAAWTHWLNRDVFRNIPGVWRTPRVRAQPWSTIKANQKIDCLIGTPHWEYEFQHYPRPETRSLAHHLMENGFDLVVGHHPHVIQPLEWAGQRLCLYSIGNLNGPSLPYVSWPLKLVGIFEVRLVAAGPRRGAIAGYRLHLFVQIESNDVVSIVPLSQAPDELRRKLETRIETLFDNNG